MYETEDSSVTSSSFGDQDDMEHFMNRCSICFDAQLDLCLEYCKDQYCIECFQKYIIETVKSSWGLSVTPIRCPVCSELIPKHEWSQYVPRKIIEIYDKFNQPYRSYSRSCPQCEFEIIPCVYHNMMDSNDQPTSKLFCNMVDSMLQACPLNELHKNHTEHIAVKRWIPIYKRQDWNDSKLPILYKRIMHDILAFEKSHLPYASSLAWDISLQFTKFCVKPEIWKQIQFAHISFFPKMQCPSCTLLVCLHCGYDAHGSLNCEESMKKMMTSKVIKKDTKDTVKWKLKHSRRCPNCSIMINREEGCNKVDCSYCGFCFCWACQLPWAEGCGFYRCSNTVDDYNENISTNNSSNAIMTTSYSTSMSEEKTELGVPNMKTIQARLVMNHHSNNNSSNMDID